MMTDAQIKILSMMIVSAMTDNFSTDDIINTGISDEDCRRIEETVLHISKMISQHPKFESIEDAVEYVTTLEPN